MGSSCCKEESEKIEKREKSEKSEKPEKIVKLYDDRKPVNISPVATALNKLAVDMYMKLASDRPNDNIFFSPLSIALALTLVETGATGKTLEEIQKLIKPGQDATECGKLYGELQEKLMECSKSGGQLSIANSIFHDTNMIVLETYLKNVKQWLNTEIFPAPFSSNPAAARQQINRWVSEKTAKKIPEVLKGLDGGTACVLVNAIYMKMDWLVKFDVEKTIEKPFYRFGGKEEQMVSFMYRKNPMYYTCEELQVIELPYKGEDMSMYVILPRSRDGIKDIEKELSADFILKTISSVEPVRMPLKVEMPKFTMRFQTSLLEIFAKLGFSSLGGLGRMSADPRLNINQAMHESYVKVDEKGTEAAAVTVTIANYCSFGGPGIDWFKADHPFLFIIMHKPTWTIVFMGKINYVENKE